MPYDNLLYETRGPAAWITLNRPDAMNALNPALVAELGQAAQEAAADRAVRAVVITGAGRAFCAGADLKFVKGALAEGVGPEMLALLDEIMTVFCRLESLPKPVIAAVNGMALAGGLELVLACDLVIAAQSAQLGDAHANFGLIPGGGGTVRLPRKIGPTRAKYLLFTGDFVPAAELLHTGLVNQVVPDGELEQAAQALAEKMASKSPLGLSRMKALVHESWHGPLEEGLRREIAAFQAHGASRDLREGLAAFNEKRAPVYTGD
ncbi:MAG: enoyl-CoA hydratase/isomerase family protein [SAR324 cluster bacterium]|nr:enoyl-CoA hydratase/isomerase family protein [SAR324 cluster bacterium]